MKLDGERADIEEFPHRFPDGDVHAIEKDGSVYVAGPELERLVDAMQVRERAAAAVDEMSAVISILWPHFRKPSVGNAQREDDRGGVGNWMFPVVGELRIKARYELRANGTVYLPADPQRPTDAQRLLTASRRSRGLEEHVIKIFAADSADQPFNERMRNWRVRNRFDLLDREDAQISQPTVEAE